MTTAGKFARTGLVRKRGPEVLAHLGVVLADRLEKEGVSSAKASEIALNIMGDLREEFGGQNIYFPQGRSQKVEEKAAEIFDKFSAGVTIEELAFEYQHSIQWIYRLIADERAMRKVSRDEAREAQRAKEYERWKREN